MNSLPATRGDSRQQQATTSMFDLTQITGELDRLVFWTRHEDGVRGQARGVRRGRRARVPPLLRLRPLPRQPSEISVVQEGWTPTHRLSRTRAARDVHHHTQTYPKVGDVVVGIPCTLEKGEALSWWAPSARPIYELRTMIRKKDRGALKHASRMYQKLKTDDLYMFARLLLGDVDTLASQMLDASERPRHPVKKNDTGHQRKRGFDLRWHPIPVRVLHVDGHAGPHRPRSHSGQMSLRAHRVHGRATGFLPQLDQNVCAQRDFRRRLLHSSNGASLLPGATLNQLSYFDTALAANVVVPGERSRGLCHRFALKSMHGSEHWVSVLCRRRAGLVCHGQHVPQLLLVVHVEMSGTCCSRQKAEYDDPYNDVSRGQQRTHFFFMFQHKKNATHRCRLPESNPNRPPHLGSPRCRATQL